MNKLFYIKHLDDDYEVSVTDTTINRISRYRGGSAFRQDMDFTILPKPVQDEIISKVTELLIQNGHVKTI